MELPYHVRALDADGFTIRQSAQLFPTVKSAQDEAKSQERRTGLKFVVCESIDDKDPRNKENGKPKPEGKRGFVVVVAKG